MTESGLYALIFTSRKEEAKRFQRWVFEEVLGVDRTQIRRLEEYQKGVCSIHTPGGIQQSLNKFTSPHWMSDQ